MAYTARARPPTVTLPRLKALTTGSSPAFLDAILNLQEEGQTGRAAFASVDSWLAQLHRRTPRPEMVFLGDDTWLRLFPRDWFALTEGVSSFFVADHTIVDVNVTRHLPDLLGDLPPVPWDVLILHYLGLDHIGHALGDENQPMHAKQREMDAVIERLWHHLARRDADDGRQSLFVLLGDHGMTPQGNHGGSSEAETSAVRCLYVHR